MANWKKQAIQQTSGAAVRPTVSACLIVRNEERRLERCLASLAGAVDEIVVIDTGSTDRSAEIARAKGAKVGTFEWCDDFSAARNAALDLATGDWVLSIDADEWLAGEGTRRFIRQEIARAGNVAFVPYVRMPDGSRYFTNARLFRRAGSRWEYRVHEQVRFVRTDTVGVFDKAFLLHHDQGGSPGEIQPQRLDRNHPLLVRELEESEVGSRAWRHAKVYLALERQRPFSPEDEAVVEEGLMTAISFDEPSCQMLTYRLYRHWIEANRFEDVNRVNEMAWRAGARGPLVHFARTVRLVDEGRLEEARRAFAEAERAKDFVLARSELQPMFEAIRTVLGPGR